MNNDQLFIVLISTAIVRFFMIKLLRLHFIVRVSKESSRVGTDIFGYYASIYFSESERILHHCISI